ncbi:MAG: Stp1/IreP family PP2C-type Ser/Thr phosphatase [Clostridia bacterium]|nr:Stp1/IreP family PP2C-type Ser/Thr phosphatase [Clostridia bacterium]
MKHSKLTNVGLVRKGNEDSICVNLELQLFGVADGMGGHEAGEIASSLASETLQQHLVKQKSWVLVDPVAALTAAFKEANRQVYLKAQSQDNCRGMGTTMTAGLIAGDQLVVGHVGDSRVYLIRGYDMTQLSQDHSLVNELLKGGGITEEEAFTHPQRNVLTRALGTVAEIETDILVEKLYQGDRLLFCTDGLSGLVPKEDMEKLIFSGLELDEVANELMRSALQNGGYDNISLVMVEI